MVKKVRGNGNLATPYYQWILVIRHIFLKHFSEVFGFGGGGGGGGVLRHYTYVGRPSDNFGVKLFSLSLILLAEEKIFSEPDNSGLKLTKKSGSDGNVQKFLRNLVPLKKEINSTFRYFWVFWQNIDDNCMEKNVKSQMDPLGFGFFLSDSFSTEIGTVRKNCSGAHYFGDRVKSFHAKSNSYIYFFYHNRTMSNGTRERRL